MTKQTDILAAVIAKPFASPSAATQVENEVGAAMLEASFAEGHRAAGRLALHRKALMDERRKILAVMNHEDTTVRLSEVLGETTSRLSDCMAALARAGAVKRVGYTTAPNGRRVVLWRKLT